MAEGVSWPTNCVRFTLSRINVATSCLIIMEKLNKELKNYFLKLNEHIVNWEAMVSKIARPLVALQNQSEQLRLVERAEGADVALLALPNLKTNLMANIKSSIEGELTLICGIMKEFQAANSELAGLHEFVLKSTNRLILRPQFVEASATCPSSSDLIDWADDTMTYYRVHLMQMNHALALLDYYNEDNVVSFVQAFQENETLKKHIDWINTVSKWFTQPQEVT